MRPRYYVEATVCNEHLGVTKVVRAPNPWELRLKVEEVQDQLRRREERARARQQVSDLKRQAEEGTREAEGLVEQYRCILAHGLAREETVDWDKAYDRRAYGDFAFSERAPTFDRIAYELQVPFPSLLEWVVPGMRARRLALEQEARQLLAQRTPTFEANLRRARAQYDRARKEFELAQAEYNKNLDIWRKGVRDRDPQYLEEYLRIALRQSPYPEGIEKELDLQYVSMTATVVVDWKLPHPDDLPRIIAYRYSARDRTVRDVIRKQREHDAFYESVVYQIVLRVLSEVFRCSYVPTLEIVAFNGWVEGSDPATGTDFTSCLVSCQASRTDFARLNLSKVDPEHCFRGLKGLHEGPLRSLVPVKPILSISR